MLQRNDELGQRLLRHLRPLREITHAHALAVEQGDDARLRRGDVGVALAEPLVQIIEQVDPALAQEATDVRELIAEGDTVAWSVWCTGTNDGEFMGLPATGRAVAFNSLNIAHFRDGKAYRHTGMLDMAAMLQQLGVPAGVS
jgi:hypothetical protein